MSAVDGAVALFELAEQSAGFLGRNAGTGISDGKGQSRFAIVEAAISHGDRHTAGVGELDAVADQIDQHLAQPDRVDQHHRRRRVDVGGDVDPLAMGAGSDQFDDVLDERFQPSRLGMQFEPTGLDAREIQHVVDQAEKRFAGRENAAGIGLLVGRQAGFLQQPGQPEDAVERGSEFVADGCQ